MNQILISFFDVTEFQQNLIVRRTKIALIRNNV